MKPGNKKKRFMVVELGNVGMRWPFEKKAGRTSKIARRLPKARLVGIDLRKLNKWFSLRRSRLPENVRQINADFLKGLRQLEDNSVSRISSHMSLGHYNSAGKEYSGRDHLYKSTLDYTTQTIKTARQKLHEGGKLVIVVGEPVLQLVKKALENGGFAKKEVSISLVKKPNRLMTYWTSAYLWFGINRNVYRVITEKKKKIWHKQKSTPWKSFKSLVYYLKRFQHYFALWEKNSLY